MRNLVFVGYIFVAIFAVHDVGPVYQHFHHGLRVEHLALQAWLFLGMDRDGLKLFLVRLDIETNIGQDHWMREADLDVTFVLHEFEVLEALIDLGVVGNAVFVAGDVLELGVVIDLFLLELPYLLVTEEPVFLAFDLLARVRCLGLLVLGERTLAVLQPLLYLPVLALTVFERDGHFPVVQLLAVHQLSVNFGACG